MPRKKSLRIRVLEGLEKRRGPGCQCCGYDVPWNDEIVDKAHMFFTIDHVHNTGNIDRKTLGLKGNAFYKWIIDHDYPNTVQILCHSCNQAKRLNGGVCPHEQA